MSGSSPTAPVAKSGNTPVVSTAQTVTRTITAHSDSYAITAAGTLQPQNDYLRIENVGSTTIVGPKIVVNGAPDWSTIDSILAEIISPGMTNDEKARAIWQFARTAHDHWWLPSALTHEGYDPVNYFNVYGYGFCGNVAAAMAALYDHVGQPSRVYNPQAYYDERWNGHAVPGAFYDGAWHMFDADLDIVFLKRDNHTIAGVEDLMDDPGLVTRAGPYGSLASLYGGSPKGR
ncbi:MAG: transglutaminase domain-containing protein, partial [Chloroflexi bacterium]|nr:transglutaminase domain-containing protein [Chloroflexota bacterium]